MISLKSSYQESNNFVDEHTNQSLSTANSMRSARTVNNLLSLEICLPKVNCLDFCDRKLLMGLGIQMFARLFITSYPIHKGEEQVNNRYKFLQYDLMAWKDMEQFQKAIQLSILLISRQIFQILQFTSSPFMVQNQEFVLVSGQLTK